MSEHQALVDAIHKLEIGLTERIHLQTTALEINNERLDNLRIAVDRHREILYGNNDGDHLGLVAEMQELKKTEKERRWTVRTVTAAFVGMVGKFLWDIWDI
jgi:hypothetical protein